MVFSDMICLPLFSDIARARKRLPRSVYWSIVAGSEQGATLTDNVAAALRHGHRLEPPAAHRDPPGPT
jgi:hypothetical protein